MLTIADYHELFQDNYAMNHSWRQTARPFEIYPNMARWIADGYIPGKRISRKLKIRLPASVVVIDGEVPDGAQALYALRCNCGQFFIPNSYRRKHCFTCSPVRRRVSG